LKTEDRTSLAFIRPGYASRNGSDWDSNSCLHQPEACPGIEVAAILELSAVLDHSVIAALCWFKHISLSHSQPFLLTYPGLIKAYGVLSLFLIVIWRL